MGGNGSSHALLVGLQSETVILEDYPVVLRRMNLCQPYDLEIPQLFTPRETPVLAQEIVHRSCICSARECGTA